VEQPLREARGPHHGQALLAADQQPEQPVEAGPVVHVGVRHREGAHPQQVPRRQRGQVAAIEQDRVGRVERFQVHARIAAPSVQQPRVQRQPHA
jgi:hypothetical protein